MTYRVDKNWQVRGLEEYAVEAIFGTLAHYGVTVDEAGYKALAQTDFPLGIAHEWHQNWSGKGQFSRFPAAASEELWRRFCAGELAPTDLALAVVKLLGALADALAGKADDGTWASRFAVVENYLPKIPEARRAPFMGELVGALGEWMEQFDRMGEALAKQGLNDLADRYVKLEEALFTERIGVAGALVQAARGQTAEAIAALVALADDAKRDDYARLSAVDALLDLEALDDSKRVLLSLVDKAEAAKDVELASASVELLTELLHIDPKLKERHEIRARVDALAKSFGSGPAEPY